VRFTFHTRRAVQSALADLLIVFRLDAEDSTCDQSFKFTVSIALAFVQYWTKTVRRCCSGGTLFTVTGRRLDLVIRPEMILYFPDVGNITGVSFCLRFCSCLHTILRTVAELLD